MLLFRTGAPCAPAKDDVASRLCQPCCTPRQGPLARGWPEQEHGGEVFDGGHAVLGGAERRNLKDGGIKKGKTVLVLVSKNSVIQTCVIKFFKCVHCWDSELAFQQEYHVSTIRQSELRV
jgi:hypothetical protein